MMLSICVCNLALSSRHGQASLSLPSEGLNHDFQRSAGVPVELARRLKLRKRLDLTHPRPALWSRPDDAQRGGEEG
jgi:hypothetical protein